MTAYIKDRLQFFVREKKHHAYRTTHPDKEALARQYVDAGMTGIQRAVARLQWMLEQEQPVVLPDDKIALLRTVSSVPEIFTATEWDAIGKAHMVHESGKVCNINPAYSLLLDVGTVKKREEVNAARAAFAAENQTEPVAYLDALLEVLDALEAFADRYREEARRVGNIAVAEAFRQVPRHRPRTFQEALQGLRLLHYCLWCSFNYHNTFGRFDQYMFPYYQKDRESGLLTEEGALELVEEFFLSCNKDSDLYPGMQQGDNGQSMVLGGLSPDGADLYNPLSALCLQASLELRLIDPKINLRVHSGTPLSLYEQGTVLTKQGLGFPQYSNDEVVIKALQNWGYEKEDAYNYVVAACWEFIVPGACMDVPNVATLSFLEAVQQAFETIGECGSFDALLQKVKEQIALQAGRLMDATRNLYMEPAPLMSLMMEGCVKNGRDISLGGKYNNYGFHGTGLSTAVDSLAAIRQFVFEEERFSGEELLNIVRTDYEGREDVLALLRYNAPKMGNDEDKVDSLATQLLDWFADALAGRRNDRGGLYRPGTGSAMYYIWSSKDEPASPDGRRKGEALACNYSPSLFSRCAGPVSIIKSFAKPNLVRVANGGPLTIELHDSMFRSEDSIHKVAMFVKSYMDMGGHQMQINAVNREEMLDAKKHPEKHRNLIVRVWGWSGYFVELDEEYQDHILERMELTV